MDNCSDAYVVVIKTIRLNLNSVEALLESDDDIRVIHLVRDPRAIIHSRWSLLRVKQPIYPLQSSMNELCVQIAHDLHVYQRLRGKYKNNLFQLKYEDLATHPQKMVKQLYKFVNLHYSQYIDAWIENNTNSGKTRRNRYSTSSANSKKAAFAWKQRIHPAFLDFAIQDGYCQYVIKELNYEPTINRSNLRRYNRRW